VDRNSKLRQTSESPGAHHQLESLVQSHQSSSWRKDGSLVLFDNDEHLWFCIRILQGMAALFSHFWLSAAHSADCLPCLITNETRLRCKLTCLFQKLWLMRASNSKYLCCASVWIRGYRSQNFQAASERSEKVI
jgi:hypothetical protein